MDVPKCETSNHLAPELLNCLANRPEVKAREVYEKKRVALIADLKQTGKIKPFTILNFNPIPLRLDGGVRQVVPSIFGQRFQYDRNLPIPKQGELFSYAYDGHRFLATQTTIREPIIFPWLRQADVVDGVPVPIYEPSVCAPIEIAHCFLESFHHAPVSMGGVIVFEGEGTKIEPRQTDMPSRAIKSRIVRKLFDWITAGYRVTCEPCITVRVPTCRRVREIKERREFFTVQRDLHEVIRQSLETQKAYCQTMIAEAKEHWEHRSEHGERDQFEEITNVVRAWHQYAYNVGWLTELPEWHVS